MAAAILLLAALFFRSCSWAEDGKAPPPSFSPDSIVNSANGSAASLSPNVLATIYGANLAYSTGQVSLLDVGANRVPTLLAGVRVTVAGIFAPLLYVSPNQVNFLIPSNILPGETDVSLVRQGVSAPKVRITLFDAAPALFQTEGGRIAATHADGGLISADAPAQPGEIIVVYGTGLGQTNPVQIAGVIPRAAAPILLLDRLRILLDGETLPNQNIYYAGITPGFPGLYQINLRLPEGMTKKNPELRVALADQISQSALQLAVSALEP